MEYAGSVSFGDWDGSRAFLVRSVILWWRISERRWEVWFVPHPF